MLQKFTLKLSALFDELPKFLVTAILITVPLFPKFPLFRIPGTYVSVRLEDFLIAVTVFFFLIIFRTKIKDILSQKITWAIILFILVGIVSILSGILVTDTIVPHIGVLHLLRRIEYLSMFFVGYLLIRYKETDKDFTGYLLKVLLLVNFFIFIYGIGQRYFNLPVIITQNEEYSKGVALRWVSGAHINSTFAGHYDLASYLILIAPLFVMYFVKVKDRVSKIILGLSLCFDYWLFSVAVSRISIASFLIATAIGLFLMKKYKEIVIFGLISIIAFGFSPDLRARYIRLYEVTIEKLSEVVQPAVFAAEEEVQVFEDRSTSIRFNVEWPRAIRAFTKNPLIGTGFSSITLATDNDYLRLLGEVGILGFGAFFLILINIFKLFIQKINLNNLLHLSLAGSLVGLLINAFFIDIFEASKLAIMLWLFIGFWAGSLYNKADGKN